MAEMLTLEKFEEAAEVVRKVTSETKLIYSEFLSNQTGNKVVLDTQKDTKSIYAQDNNGTKYYSYSHEILGGNLKVNNGFSTQIAIKFSKSYSIDRPISNIIFSDIVLNEETNKKVIKINL